MVCMHACMHGCMYVSMYVCMYVYTYVMVIYGGNINGDQWDQYGKINE